MHDTHTTHHFRHAGRKPLRRGYWSGFSVCLFVVVLAVFTWVVHRRLTQYESTQQTGGHHLIATKVCLTERLQVSVPTTQTPTQTMTGPLFFAVIVFAFALLRLDNSKRLVLRDSLRSRFVERTPPCLTHFFFLPPPAPYFA